jgi:hypothetical protein
MPFARAYPLLSWASAATGWNFDPMKQRHNPKYLSAQLMDGCKVVDGTIDMRSFVRSSLTPTAKLTNILISVAAIRPFIS